MANEFSRASPYPGPRPFEIGDAALFFGRDGEVRDLSSLILAHRLVLLHAQSGAGKTSLLNAGVIPWLIQNQAFDVLPVARVGGAIPKDIDASKIDNIYVFNTLIKWAAKGDDFEKLKSMSMHSFLEERQRPTDTEGVAAPRLVVFDQLEELFTSYRARWKEREGFCRQVAEAVEADSQLRVLFAIRDDYLADLYTLSSLLPEGLRTTFRLERLKPRDACLAIERPLQGTGYSFEVKVAAALCDELTKVKAETASGETVEVTGEYVEPVQLQVVCQNLWMNLPQGVTVISSSHIMKFGNVEDALKNLYETAVCNVAKETSVKEDVLRLWFGHQLITPGGTRGMVFQERERTGGIPNEAVKKLEDEHHIIRADVRAGSRWYELTHDRLISPIQKANAALEQRLNTRRMEGKILSWAGVVATIAVMVGTLLFFQQRAHLVQQKLATVEEWRDGGLLKELRDHPKKLASLAASHFDLLASHFLWEKTGADRFDRLKDVLVQYQDLLPEGYGIRTPGQGEAPALGGHSPLKIEYSPARKLDPRLFPFEWLQYAESVAGKWGIPAPAAVELAEAPDLPKQRIRIVASGVPPLEFDLDLDEDRVLLILLKEEDVEPNVEDLYEPVRQFHKRFRNDWKPFNGEKVSDQWWLVPRWSLPVWKVGMNVVQPNFFLTSGSGVTAFRLFQYLLKNPEPLLSAPAINFLLQRKSMRDTYGETVQEAIHARENRLGFDLAAIVRKGVPLFSLPQILDGLAEAWDEESTAIAKRFDEIKWMDQGERIPARLHGPWQKSTEQPPMRESEIETPAYADIEPYLPPVEYPLRAYVGEKLIKTWFVGESLSPRLLAKLNELRDDFHRVYGIRLPGIRFYAAAPGDAIAPNAVRLEMLNERAGPNGPQPEVLNRDDSISDFIPIARRAAEDLRIFWITAETVQQLVDSKSSETGTERDTVAPNTSEWLKNNYSLTDLKILLRAVVAPTTRGPETTARYSKWLLASLVFWSKVVGDPLDTAQLRDYLRTTQKARLQPRSSNVPPNVGKAIEQGIDALVQDRVAEAETEFSGVVKQDRAAAIAEFLAVWPKKLPRLWLGASDLRFLVLSRTERLDLEDMSPALDRRYVNLCLLAAGAVKGDKEAAIERELLMLQDPVEKWPPEHACWLAQRFISHYDPLKDGQRLFAYATALMKNAIVRLDEAQAYDAFTDVLEIASKRPTDWVWSLLNELAGLRPEGLRRSLQLALALRLCNEERPERLTNSLSLVEHLEKLLQMPNVNEEDRVFYSEWVRYIRACAFHGLARQGDETRWQGAEGLLKSLLASKTENIAMYSYIRLIQLMQERGRYDEADTLYKTTRQGWPDNLTLQSLEMFGSLQRGRKESAIAIARRAAALAQRESNPSSKGEALYLAAIGGILTHLEGWEDLTSQFLLTNHDYLDYVCLMFYAYSGGRVSPSAQKFLATRWAQITISSWPERLRNGDISVWREMLIGRFVGKLSENDLFGKLQDENAWQKSDLFHLPVSRRGLLCEAWFYEAILAKAEGQNERMRECLRRCIAVGYTSYLEPKMAAYLLSGGN